MTYSRENKYWHWSAFCQEIDAERAYHTNSFQTLVFIHVIQRHAKKSKQISVFTQKLGSLSIQIFVLADLVLIDEKVCFFYHHCITEDLHNLHVVKILIGLVYKLISELINVLVSNVGGIYVRGTSFFFLN